MVHRLPVVALPVPPVSVLPATRAPLLPIHPLSGARRHGPSTLNRPPHTSTSDGRRRSRPSSNKRPPETPSATRRGRWPLHEVIQIHMHTGLVSASKLSLHLSLVSDDLPRSCTPLSLSFPASARIEACQGAAIHSPHLVVSCWVSNSAWDIISRPPLLVSPAGLSQSFSPRAPRPASSRPVSYRFSSFPLFPRIFPRFPCRSSLSPVSHFSLLLVAGQPSRLIRNIASPPTSFTPASTIQARPCWTSGRPLWSST